MKGLSLVWEIPLALLSWLFYKAMKLVMGNLYTLYLAINKKRASQWQVLSQETLKKALSLPVLATKAPRWNTHAIIGTLGPISVQQEIALEAQTATAAAESWIAVIYGFPSYKTITSLESSRLGSEPWASLTLKPGKYTIGLRYYHWHSRVKLPAAKIDGELSINELEIPANVNDFYHHLSQNRSWFYAWLHYYIFVLLRLRTWFSEGLVKGEFLPVGAPDTDFFYGHLEAGQALQIEIEPAILERSNLYLTLYNCASFPTDWCQIYATTQTLAAAAVQRLYLIRVRPQPMIAKAGGQNLPLSSQIVVTDALKTLKITVQM